MGYAVVFNHVSNADAVYDYSLLFNSSNQDVPSTKYHSPVQDYRQGINYDFTSEYARHGFCTLQILIDDFAVKSQDSSFEGIKESSRFRCRTLLTKEMISTLLQRQSFLSYLCFAFCIPSAVFSPCWYWKKNPDCGNDAHDGRWRLFHRRLVVHHLRNLLDRRFSCSCICKRKLFPNSAAVVTFFIFLFFGLGTFSFCFFLSSFFWKARTAAIVGPVMYFMGFFLYYLIQAPDVGKPAALLLFPQVSFALTIKSVSTLEENGKGLLANNLADPVENFAPGRGIFMMLFDIFFFTFLGIYCDKVIPQQYGSKLPWHFPVSSIFRIFARKRTMRKRATSLDVELMNSSDDDTSPAEDSREGVSEERERIVSLKNLRKFFE